MVNKIILIGVGIVILAIAGYLYWRFFAAKNIMKSREIILDANNVGPLLTSKNRQYSLHLHPDGMPVIMEGETPITNFDVHRDVVGSLKIQFQRDLNLVVYDANGALWTPRYVDEEGVTHSTYDKGERGPAAKVELGNDGILRLYDNLGEVLWDSTIQKNYKTGVAAVEEGYYL